MCVEESTSVLMKLKGFAESASPNAKFSIKFNPSCAPGGQEDATTSSVLFHEAALDTAAWASERQLLFLPAPRGDRGYFTESFELVRWRASLESDPSLLPFTLRYDVRQDVLGGALSVLLTLRTSARRDHRFAEPVVVTVPLPGNTLRLTIASCTGGDKQGALSGRRVRSTARLETEQPEDDKGGVKTAALVWRVHGVSGGAATLAAEVARTPHLLHDAWEPPNARAQFTLPAEPKNRTVKFLKVVDQALGAQEVTKWVRYSSTTGRFEALPNFTRTTGDH
jgi:hypothetical protein